MSSTGTNAILPWRSWTCGPHCTKRETHLHRKLANLDVQPDQLQQYDSLRQRMVDEAKGNSGDSMLSVLLNIWGENNYKWFRSGRGLTWRWATLDLWGLHFRSLDACQREGNHPTEFYRDGKARGKGIRLGAPTWDQGKARCLLFTVSKMEQLTETCVSQTFSSKPNGNCDSCCYENCGERGIKSTAKGSIWWRQAIDASCSFWRRHDVLKAVYKDQQESSTTKKHSLSLFRRVSALAIFGWCIDCYQTLAMTIVF